MHLYCLTLALLVLGCVNGESTSSADTCDASPGPWAALLEEWATQSASAASSRHGRVMSMPSTKAYYVIDRIDGQLIPPPPPPGSVHHKYQPGPSPPHYYEEWQESPPPPPAGGKIVNRPTNPHKDMFKPSYEYPLPSINQPIPVPPPPPPAPPRPQRPAVDRVDEQPSKPHKHVTETDLYLLTAIEKLVYRVDLMEKRLRKMEETMHYLVAGKDATPEPCKANFTRVGGTCYYFSSEAADWKRANLHCRKLRGNLLEFDSDAERKQVLSAMLSDKRLRGDDWWTGGLNPGLLWIWSHSAQAVLGNATNNTSNTGGVVGEGRCLSLTHDPAAVTYRYRGLDCAEKHRFVCEREEDKERLSNEIERVAKQIKFTGQGLRKARTLWDDNGGAD
ncbi:uncharacterized protein LOC113522431 [Galleria mellonella]|uniref:Uncharacterized protein LOC113522431 n=1 Tax=Galleria mellonella TaxID=7137 RepID=A0A6J3CE20_GALME|nr:uncharacterized protein LOC113522431 [Galleria mellonella]